MPKRRHIERTLPTNTQIAISLERIDGDEPVYAIPFGGSREDEGESRTVAVILQAEGGVVPGKPEDLLRYPATEILPVCSTSPGRISE
jgi:hypothetical protein